MRDFSWKYFSMTGDVDAYLLYKEMNNESDDEVEVNETDLEAESDDWIH